MRYKFSNLIDENGNAPFSPAAFAKEMAKNMNEKYNSIVRVSFYDNYNDHIDGMLQEREDGGFTGYDHLILSNIYENDIQCTFWVDEGTLGMPIALAFESDKESREITATPFYESHNFAKKLTKEELTEMMFQAIEFVAKIKAEIVNKE